MVALEVILNDKKNDEYLPKGWEGIQVQATWDNNTIQPNIVTSDIEFTGQGATDINSWIDDGASGSCPGIFEGISCKFNLVKDDVTSIFDGYIDTTQIDRQCDIVKVKLIATDGINGVNETSQALSYQYLESIGELTQADYEAIPYVVNYVPDGVEIVIMLITIYLMERQIEEFVKEIAEYTIDTANPFTAANGILKLILLLATIALLIYQIVTLINAIFENLYSDIRYYKGIRVKRLLEVGAAKLGLQLSSSLFASTYKNLTYLPYKNEKGQPTDTGNQSGSPVPQGYGYTFFEIIKLVQNMFNAKLLVKDGVLHIESLDNESFWKKNADYTLPNIEVLNHGYNTDELKANYLLRFETDIQDQNTIDEFTGTNYERITSPNVVTNSRNVLLKGLEEINFSMALGTRKTGLSDLEKTLQFLGNIVDSLMTTVGWNSNLAAKVANRIGMMNNSSDFVNVPKLLILQDDNKLLSNHRTVLSAASLHEYHKSKSFVADDFKYQAKTYKDVTIPFCFEDYLKVINNSYCNTVDGKEAKIEKLLWTFGGQYAEISYKIYEPYTRNLNEQFITG